jgi:hypothetical protein
MLYNIQHSISHAWSDLPIGLLMVWVHWIISNQNICTKIRGENYQSIPEIDLVTLTIRQESFVQYLE